MQNVIGAVQITLRVGEASGAVHELFQIVVTLDGYCDTTGSYVGRQGPQLWRLDHLPPGL